MGVRLTGEALSSAASASASASAAAGAGGEVIARQCGRWEHGKLVEERAVPLTYLPPNAPLPSRAAGAAQIYPFGTCWTGAVDAAGQAYGPGLMHRADGAQFRGTFTADTLSGPGSARWPDGAKYTGEFKEGSMHGVGAFTFPDGKIYAGQFEHDAPQGLGVQWSAVGKGKNAVVVELMGRWAGGELAQMGPIPTAPIAALAQIKGALPLKVLPTGSGIRNSSLLLPNGGWYKGRYSTASYPYVPDTSNSSTAGGADETGQPAAAAANADDVGTLFDPSGAEVARGSWRNGVQEGVGSISLNGDRFEGMLRSGAPHGEGVMRFAGNGCAFEGQWDEGRSRGFGVQWGPQGQLLQCGRWDAGALVERRPVPLACLPQKLFLSPLCAASASLLFPDGGFYVGATRTDPTSKKKKLSSKDKDKDLQQLQRHGEGTMYTPDGRVQRQGFWEADLPIAAPPKDDKA
jgi:hypothetical protein